MNHSPFNMFFPIAIGCDHAGFDYKEELKKYLQGQGLTVNDFGTHSKDSVDYPDFAHPLSESVEKGECSFGILLCGTANGVAITANKHQGIRAALCWDTSIAEMARLHNNANVICIPARYVSLNVAQQMVQIFMTTEFEGARHAGRVAKMSC